MPSQDSPGSTAATVWQGPAQGQLFDFQLSARPWLKCPKGRWPLAEPPADGFYWIRERGYRGAEIAAYRGDIWIMIDGELPLLRDLVVDSDALLPPSDLQIVAFAHHQAIRTDTPNGSLLEGGFYWIQVGNAPPEPGRLYDEWSSPLRGPLRESEFVVLWGPIPEPPFERSKMLMKSAARPRKNPITSRA